MTAAWAGVVVAALVASAGALGIVVRLSVRWTRFEARQDNLAERIGDLLANVREDRQATNARLTWLERRAWPSGRARRRAIDDSGD